MKKPKPPQARGWCITALVCFILAILLALVRRYYDGPLPWGLAWDRLLFFLLGSMLLCSARGGFITKTIRGDIFEGTSKTHPGQFWLNMLFMLAAGLALLALACWP